VEERLIDELTIEDEKSFRHVAIYARLKEVLRRDRYVFRILPPGSRERWDRALFLNLTYWGGAGGDVLVSDRIPADVVAHAAWHHLASGAFTRPPGEPPTADALFMGEAIASAFDAYLVGRLLSHAPRSAFLETQVPAMAEAAGAAGLPEEDYEALLGAMAEDPERAFEDLRALLFDATTELVRAPSADEALTALERMQENRFASLLHHYELSNWVLYARAYAARGKSDPRVSELDKTLRVARDPLGALADRWLLPAC
jgi:hypothetical protein